MSTHEDTDRPDAVEDAEPDSGAGPGGAAVLQSQIAAEQHALDTFYARLDQVRQHTEAELDSIRMQRAGGNPQNRSERDSMATLFENRLAQLNAVENRLCFGRLDLRDDERRYIGRIGLADGEQTRLLVDWRAQAAEPFYQATAANPGDVVLRRHLVTSGRAVTGIEDDVLDLDALSNDQRSRLGGEGALLAALSAQRTGRMSDIVATIQAEQDTVIRAGHTGVLVVEGGPGTGKTAVALHRAAYLLYAHRERLSRSGVLVVGPSPVFMRYIDRVLPSLGETGVVMLTAGELFPGVRAHVHDAPHGARLKGDLRMVQTIAGAIADRQRVPDAPVRINLDGSRIELTAQAVRAARDRARRTGKPHNVARVGFAKDLLNHLADLVGASLGAHLSPEDRAVVIADLRSDVDVRRAINLAWMPITPQDLVDRLLSDPRRLASSSPWLSEEDIEALIRPRGTDFTVEDVPLLDEAAEQLGEDPSAAQAEADRAAAQRAEDLNYARAVVSMTGTAGLVSTDMLADRFAGDSVTESLSERAAVDRTWAFGHVVVDEAQECSPMMWRLLGRRNPARSMTVVGDLAQTRSAASPSTWEQALEPLVQDRWRLERLAFSYRTPRRIMQLATAMLQRAGVQVPTPESVRDVPDVPVATRLPAGRGDTWAAQLAAVVSAEWEQVRGGRLGVIGTDDVVEDALIALRGRDPGASVGRGSTAIDQDIAVLTVEEVKGLEFDGVVIIEPARIIEQGARGHNDLYVAMTRPTARLHLVYTQELPPGLEQLAAVSAENE